VKEFFGCYGWMGNERPVGPAALEVVLVAWKKGGDFHCIEKRLVLAFLIWKSSQSESFVSSRPNRLFQSQRFPALVSRNCSHPPSVRRRSGFDIGSRV